MSSTRVLHVPSWIVGLGLTALVGIFWVTRVWLTGSERDLSTSDLFLYYLPSYELLYGALREGRLPLWNPYQICGTPQLASLQAGFFYPGHLAYLVLPVEAGWVLSSVLHLALVAGTMLALVRRLGFGAAAGLAAGVFLALRGRYPGMIFFPNWLEASAWLPLGALAVTDLVRPTRPGPWGRMRGLCLLAACTALSLLAGYPQASVYLVYSWGALLLLLLVVDRRGPRDWLAAGAGMAASLVVGFAIAAVQLLPAWELTAQGTRSPGPLTRGEQFPMAWHGPDFAGALAPTLKAPFPELYLSFGFVALLGIAAALLWRRGRGLAVGSLAMAFLVLCFAMGPATPVFDWLSQLPALGWFRFPRRALFMLDFFAAIAFAIGVDGLLRWARLHRPELPRPAATALALAPALLLVVEVFNGAPSRVGLRDALALLSHYDRQSPVYDRVAASGERAWIRSPTIESRQPPKLASFRQMKSVGDYEPLNQRRQSDYFTYLTQGRLSPRRAGRPYSGRLKHLTEPTYPNALATRGHLLDVAAVQWLVVQRVATKHGEIERYIEERGLVEEPGVHDPDFVLLRNPDAAPRAYVVYDVRPAPEPLALMQALADRAFDPLDWSYAENAPPVRGPLKRGHPARIVVDEPTRVEIEAELERDGFLVLVDSFYPGWQASASGEPLEILPVNHLFRGVPLPAGRHRVVFAYRPWTVPVGAAVSVAGLLVLGALAWLETRRRPADELPASGRSDSMSADAGQESARGGSA